MVYYATIRNKEGQKMSLENARDRKDLPRWLFAQECTFVAGADKMELEKYTLGSLRRAVFEGDTVSGSLMAGQVAGMLHEVRPVADILADLWQGGRQRIAALNAEC